MAVIHKQQAGLREHPRWFRSPVHNLLYTIDALEVKMCAT